ncbi:hypothetical protein ACHAXT_007563 [Thalassiosira profunda]
MDHYFSSIAKHLTDGSGGAGGGEPNPGPVNGNATPRGSQGQQQMMMAAMQQQQQQQQQQGHQQQGGQMGQMGRNMQGNNMMQSGLPGPLQGLPSSRQSSITSQRQMSQGPNVMPSGLPGPLQGLPGGGSAGGRQGSIGSRQGSVGLQQAMGRQSSGGNSQQSQQSQQQQLQIMQQQQAMQQQQIQQQQRSSISSANNPYTSKELLTMLDDDLQESNQTRGNGKQPQTQQQSQQQMMMMQAAMMNRQKQMQEASQGGQPGQQTSQQHPQQALNAAQQRQAELQAQLQRQAQMKAQAQQNQQQQQGMNQQGAAQGPGQGQGRQQPPASAQTQMSQQKQQIHNFLQLHGHQLTQQQRLSLQQQLSALQQQAGGSGMSSSGGSSGKNQSQMGSGGQQSDMRQGNAVMIQPPPQAPPVTDAAALTANSAQMANAAAMAAMAQAMGQDPNNPVLNMDDLMFRQRDQLKHLQTMIKGATDPAKAAMLQAQHAMLQQAMLQRHLEQQMQQQQGGGGQGRQPSASSVVMQQMLLAAAQQQREESISPVPIGPTKAFPKHVQSQGTTQKAVASSAGPLPAAVGSAGGGSAPARTTTRVVPVSISPFAAPGGATEDSSRGGVSDAALIYTKCALRSIIASLNNRAKAKSGGPLAREYTVRDLSTCLGAWDLNVPKSPGGSKRQKLDDGKSSSESDGNAETAFQFYYERSCPILLDAKHDSAPVPFYVEDFGNNAIEGTSDDSLPVVVGAVVLTYGADEKFTGGIGEEGVLTKAIVEFFCEETALTADASEDALAEAEERMFARVDPAEEQSGSLIQASLYALSPNVVASEPPPSSSSSADSSDKDSATGTSSLDDGVYIPTIWSGNTDRVYQYCLLGNFDDNGRERQSKRLCVAIQKKRKEDQCQVGGGDKGPAKGVCRITLTLSPQSVQAKKKQMAKEREDGVERHSSSEVHRKIRKNLRILRPPKLTTVSGPDIQPLGGKRRRQALRRRSVTQMIDQTQIVVGVRCKHELLLDADEVGKIYVNGTLLADCSSSTRDSSKGIVGADALPAHTLFGVDFTLPSSIAEKTITIKSELPSKLVLEREYGALLVDALIAGQVDADVGGKLLGRLVSGSTEQPDGFDLGEVDVLEPAGTGDRYHDQLPRTENCCSIKFDDVSRPCLESIVLSSSMADPVGIGAKALGTRFRVQYGKEAFPFEVGSYDECRIPHVLGAQKIAVPVPRRAREVLYRGAYLPLDKMAQFLWAGAGGVSSTSWDGDHGDAMRAAEAMEGAIQLLRKSGCKDVQPNKVKFVAKKKLEPTDTGGSGDSSKCTPSVSKLRCWYDSDSGSYYVSDGFLFVEEGEGAEEEESGASGSSAGPSAINESKARTSERSGEVETKLPDGEANGKESEAAAEKENDGEPKPEGDEDNEKKAESAEGKAKKSSDSKSEIPDGAEPDNEQNPAKGNTTSAPAKPDNAPKESAGEKKLTGPKHASAKDAAYRLAFYIAKEHPDAAVLERFVMCHRS